MHIWITHQQTAISYCSCRTSRIHSVRSSNQNNRSNLRAVQIHWSYGSVRFPTSKVSGWVFFFRCSFAATKALSYHHHTNTMRPHRIGHTQPLIPIWIVLTDKMCAKCVPACESQTKVIIIIVGIIMRSAYVCVFAMRIGLKFESTFASSWCLCARPSFTPYTHTHTSHNLSAKAFA